MLRTKTERKKRGMYVLVWVFIVADGGRSRSVGLGSGMA